MQKNGLFYLIHTDFIKEIITLRETINIYKIVNGFINKIYFKRKLQIIHYLQNRRLIYK